MNIGTIDIGNTRVKLAVFRDRQLVSFEYKNSFKEEDLQEWSSKNSLDRLAYVASGKDNEEVILALQNCDALLLSHKSRIPIKIEYNTPETLGRDRLAAVLGAYKLFPSSAALIIDAGTCITYDWLSDQGIYLGGNISPGMKMRAKAMHEYTAKLPMVALEEEVDNIGQSTHSAIRNGAVMGTICEIESFIRRTERWFIDFRVILTGGDAKRIEELIQEPVEREEQLIHHGLQFLVEYNEKRK